MEVVDRVDVHGCIRDADYRIACHLLEVVVEVHFLAMFLNLHLHASTLGDGQGARVVSGSVVGCHVFVACISKSHICDDDILLTGKGTATCHRGVGNVVNREKSPSRGFGFHREDSTCVFGIAVRLSVIHHRIVVGRHIHRSRCDCQGSEHGVTGARVGDVVT